MEFHRYLKILLAHKRTIILLCLSATLHAVFLTYVLSEKYKATALVLIRPQEEMKLGPKEKEAFNFPISNIPFETVSHTYSEILQSQAIAERIVQLLKMDTWERNKEDNPYYEMWLTFKDDAKEFLIKVWALLKYGRIEEGGPYRTAVNEVKDNISITPTKDTYLFEITYKAKHPKVAAVVANTAVEVFAEYSSEANKAEAMTSRDFFRKQVEEKAANLQEARDSLQHFKEENGTVSYDEEATARIKLISDFELSIEVTEKEIKGLQAEIGETQDLLSAQSKFIKGSSAFSEDPVVKKYKKRLTALETKLAGAGTDSSDEKMKYSVSASQLNIRADASTDTLVIGTLTKGDVFIAEENVKNHEGLWHKVANGYVSSTYTIKLPKNRISHDGPSPDAGEGIHVADAGANTLKAQIEETKSKLNKEIKKILSVRASSLNSVQQGLLQTLISAESELQSLQAERKSIISTLSKHKYEMKGFPEKELQLIKLQLDLKVAEDTYKVIKREYEDAKISEAKRVNEIRVISPATAPLYPSEPIKIYYAGTAFTLALIIGVGFAFFSEYINITIRTIEDAEKILEWPVLTTLPTAKSVSGDAGMVDELSVYLMESKKRSK